MNLLKNYHSFAICSLIINGVSELYLAIFELILCQITPIYKNIFGPK